MVNTTFRCLIGVITMMVWTVTPVQASIGVLSVANISEEQERKTFVQTADQTLADNGIQLAAADKKVHEVLGIVISVDATNGRLILDHEAVEGFMDSMIMGYSVSPNSLLLGLEPGAEVLFTIDAESRLIVGVKPVSE